MTAFSLRKWHAFNLIVAESIDFFLHLCVSITILNNFLFVCSWNKDFIEILKFFKIVEIFLVFVVIFVGVSGLGAIVVGLSGNNML